MVDITLAINMIVSTIILVSWHAQWGSHFHHFVIYVHVLLLYDKENQFWIYLAADL